MPPPLAPWPTIVNGRRIVAPDVDSIDARLRFDVAAQEATGEAVVRFTAGDETGHPALDLRQPVEWLRLDGESLAPEAFAPLDLGAGPGSEMRVLDVTLEAGSRHQLEVGYRLDTPAATGSEPIAGSTAASGSTCGCPTCSPAATWRCGCRRRSSMTASRLSSTSSCWKVTGPMR